MVFSLTEDLNVWCGFLVTAVPPCSRTYTNVVRITLVSEALFVCAVIVTQSGDWHVAHSQD
jgi:hypothetical protein